MLHNPSELRAWIKKRLELVWKLDAALTVAENDEEANQDATKPPPKQPDPTPLRCLF